MFSLVGLGVNIDYKIYKKKIISERTNNKPIFEWANKIIPIKHLDGTKNVAKGH